MTLDEAIKHAEEVMIENLEKTKDRNASDPIAINCFECAEEHRQLAEWLKELKQLREQARWIPIKIRPLTEAEKEEYKSEGLDWVDFVYDCPLPEDSQEVLVSTQYNTVDVDTFYRDEGCYFEYNCNADDLKAWMPLPNPYNSESEV